MVIERDGLGQIEPAKRESVYAYRSKSIWFSSKVKKGIEYHYGTVLFGFG